MKHPLVVLGFAATALATLLLVGERYVEKHTTKIDEAVTIITLDEHVIVMQKGAPPSVVRVRPPITPTRDEKAPATKTQPAVALKWTLPFSCETARSYAARFTQSQLDAMRKAAGMAMPTAAQQQQIRACIAGRLR